MDLRYQRLPVGRAADLASIAEPETRANSRPQPIRSSLMYGVRYGRETLWVPSRVPLRFKVPHAILSESGMLEISQIVNDSDDPVVSCQTTSPMSFS